MARELLPELERRGDLERTVPEALLERLAFGELHDVERPAALVAPEVEHGDHARVVGGWLATRASSSKRASASRSRGVGGEEELEREAPLDAGPARLENDAHAPRPSSRTSV